MLNLNRTLARVTAAVLLAGSLGLGVATTAQAAWRTASQTEHYYSWAGIHVASLGVQGDYNGDGKKITKFDGVRAYPNTYAPLTTYGSVSKGWKNKTSTSGAAYAEATWKMGIKTMWIELTVQSFRDSVTAYANANKC